MTDYLVYQSSFYVRNQLRQTRTIRVNGFNVDFYVHLMGYIFDMWHAGLHLFFGLSIIVGGSADKNSNHYVDVYFTDLIGNPAGQELATVVRSKLEDKRRALHDLQVLPAKVYPVSIAVKLVLRPDAEFEKVRDQITTQVKSYLKGRSQIVYQQIGALFFVDGVIDFTSYTLNGGELNLTVPADSISTLTMAVAT